MDINKIYRALEGARREYMKRREIVSVKGKCGVYKITCLVNGRTYIGSSCNICRRWMQHTTPSTWKREPNKPLYADMKVYGVDSFDFEILYECCKPLLRILEKKAIELHKPEYNTNSPYQTTEEKIEQHNRCSKQYHQTDKWKEHKKQYDKQYNNQMCIYNGERLTLNALTVRFYRAGITHPTAEAKKYLL